MPDETDPSTFVISRIGFLTLEAAVWLPKLKEGGLQDVPSWLWCGRELYEQFPQTRKIDAGSITVAALSCGWDMNPVDFMGFIHKSRSLWNSWLHIAEILHILERDHLADKGKHPRSPLYFLALGHHGECRLIEAKRNQGRGFVIESSREVGRNAKILKGHPLYLPAKPR